MSAPDQAATPEAVEEVLSRCIERAIAAGVAIVWGAFEVYSPDADLNEWGEPCSVIGCCAVGAHQWFAADGESSALGCAPTGVIAAGFDGELLNPEELGSEAEWYAVGARLRERYQPVPASTIGGGA